MTFKSTNHNVIDSGGGHSPVVTVQQAFTALQQCGYLILQLARFMWCERGLWFHPSLDMEIVRHCCETCYCTVLTLNGKEGRLNRKKGQIRGLCLGEMRYKNVELPVYERLSNHPMYRIDIKDNKLAVT